MKSLGPGEIADLLPQQDPFLFVDHAEIEADTVRARRLFRGDEFFFQGHFKTRPVVPAAILSEAAGQTASLWIAVEGPARLLPGETLMPEFLFVAMEEMRFRRLCVPGETIQVELKLTRFRTPMAVFSGIAHVAGELVARFDAMTLACAAPAAVPVEAFP